MTDRRQQWLRGVLDLCVLATLQEQDRHGYAIARRLDEAGLGVVKGGTLYPMLARLQVAELVTARWEAGQHGPGRKYYALAEAGRALLREQNAAWIEFTRTTQTLIDSGGTT